MAIQLRWGKTTVICFLACQREGNFSSYFKRKGKKNGKLNLYKKILGCFKRNVGKLDWISHNLCKIGKLCVIILPGSLRFFHQQTHNRKELRHWLNAF